jgi:hypothetical protein
MPVIDRNPEPRGRLRRRSEAVKRETADVDRAGNQDVANEDEPERGLSGGELFAEILQMKLRRLEQLLVGTGVKGGELVLRRRRTDLLAGPAIQPVRTAVVDDGRLMSDALHRYPYDPSL